MRSGRGSEGLVQGKGGAGLDDGGRNEGRGTWLNSGYFDLISSDVGVWEREEFRE